MKTVLSLVLLFAACLSPGWSATESARPQSHPLKVVVVSLLPEKTALLVKHEEIPGVMRPMTMLFKVEPSVLAQVKPGDTITARLSHREDGWWLTDLAVISHPKQSLDQTAALPNAQVI